jgi:hypothetical protein
MISQRKEEIYRSLEDSCRDDVGGNLWRNLNQQLLKALLHRKNEAASLMKQRFRRFGRY